MSTLQKPTAYHRNTDVFVLRDVPQSGAQLRQYVLAVRDLPPDDRPRERLCAQGPAALSMSELLAVVLGRGTRKEEVLAMTSRITKEYGERNILSQKNPAALATDLDIPLGKAMQIVAVGELGRRVYLRNESGATLIRTAEDVFNYVADMRTLTKEHLRGIYLNTHYKVIHSEMISIGTVDASIIHPREVFKPALEYSAAAVILVHNHPSGELTPSEADVAITKQLVEAGKMLGVGLIDHVIVTKDAYKSIPVAYQ